MMMLGAVMVEVQARLGCLTLRQVVKLSRGWMASIRAAEICQADSVLEKSAIFPLEVEDDSCHTY